MNVNKKAASLYQSMDLWIALYRRIHECDHNTAHDAFDAWADTLKGESADQSTPQFHEAVHASYEAMLAKAPKEVEVPPVQHNHSVTKRIFVPGSLDKVAHIIEDDVKINFTGEAAVSKPIPNLFGGPILETGNDPLSFKDSYKEENLHWGQKTPHPILTAAEVRAQLEKVVSDANAYLDELGDVGHPIDVDRTVKMKELAECRLRLIDEVEAREKERSGKRLSLPKKA